MTLAGKRTRQEIIEQVAALVDTSGIDLDQVGKLEQVKLYQGFYKDADGVAHKVDMTAVQLAPSWDSGPEWPVVQPAKPTVVRPVASTNRKTSTSSRETVILPDPQIGYRMYPDGSLDPFHDEAAFSVAMQIVREVDPDCIVNLGDTCDFPEWSSKFLVSPEFVNTTQPTLDRTHLFLAEQRANAPRADIFLMEGNHDDRLAISITKNAMAALRLRPGGTHPDHWPVLSLPNLLRLDDLGVTYVSGYPAGRVKIADGCDGQAPLYAIHGEKLDMAKVAKSERESFVQGHGHHVQDYFATYDLEGEPWVVNAFMPGCLCRIDGAVPSTKGGTDVHGRVVRRIEGWQQAVAVVTEIPGQGWTKEIVPIHNGRAIFRGRVFSAVQSDAIPTVGKKAA